MEKLRFTFRILKQNPLLTFVCLPGLALGLAAAILLWLYVQTELSYDHNFATHDRVLRLNNVIVENNHQQTLALCFRDSYTEIPARVPAVEAATQIYQGWEVGVKNDNKQYRNKLLFADNGFFKVFDQYLIQGDTHEALKGKNKVVINTSTAKKIFKDESCMGKTLYIDEKPYVISGIIKDLPDNTHFHFDLLASIETMNPENFRGLEFYTYFLIHKNANIELAAQKIEEINNKLMVPFKEELNISVNSKTELLSDIHLKTDVDVDLSQKANPLIILIVSLIALFILLIATINYINLYILHGEKRINEIATRKTLGAGKSQLIRIFYSETTVIVGSALILALLIVKLSLPWFSTIINRPVSFPQLLSANTIGTTLLFLILLIFASGAYPSLYLSKINVISGLKGYWGQIKRKNRLSVSSVLVQFTITVFLLSSLFVVISQVRYLKKQSLGFNPNHVEGITNLTNNIKNSHVAITNELQNLPFIESVACSNHSMGSGTSGQGIRKFGSTGKYESINQYRVQANFCKVMQMELVKGRYLNNDESDKNSVILNQSAAKMLNITDIENERVEMFGTPMKIAGIVQDFYYGTPGSRILPLVITDYTDETSNIYYRTQANITPAQREQIIRVFKKYDPSFIPGTIHVSEVYAQKFTELNRLVKLVSISTYLIIILSFMGLVALSIFNINGRTKEIGVRKVNGATIQEILVWLNKSFIVWVVVAFIIAVPIAYFAMDKWLNQFTFKINLSWWLFVLAGLTAMSITLITISWQSFKAARRNPVEALRYE